MFSKAGPYLRSPDVTNRPSVIPKRYKLKKSNISDGPKLNMETPKKGVASNIAGIIPITSWRIHNNIAPELHGEGNQSRDFIYVTDTVDAVVKLFDVMPAGESVNISTDNCCTVKNLLDKIIAHYEYNGELVNKEARGADVLTHNASNEKVKSLISYSLTSFEEGLAETLDWYRNEFSEK